jgi:MFS family permease
MTFGYASDLVERKKLLSRTVSRKVFQATALIGAAIFMALIPAVGCNQISVIVLLILGMIVLGLISGGENPIVVDIAPDYSGSIYGFTNAFSSLPGFLAPLFAGLILDKTNVRYFFLIYIVIDFFY